MRLNCDVDQRGDVTLVTLHLTNDGERPRHVRVANRLDGPVLFPCRHGKPAPGWDADGWAGTLTPDEGRALGYACRADPSAPPAAVVETGPPAEQETTPAAVLAARGDPRPPRDAVPVPAADRSDGESMAPADAVPDDARSEPAPSGSPDDPVPPAVDAWLGAVSRRAETGGSPKDQRALRAVGQRVDHLRHRLESP